MSNIDGRLKRLEKQTSEQTSSISEIDRLAPLLQMIGQSEAASRTGDSQVSAHLLDEALEWLRIYG